MRKTIITGGMVLAGALAVLAAASAPAAAQTPNAATLDALKKCAAIADADSRHICTDAVMQGAGLLGSESPAAAPAAGDNRAAKAPEAAAVPKAPKVAAPAAPAPSSGARQAEELTPAQRRAFYPEEALAEEEKEKKENVDLIEVTLNEVSKTGDGRLVLTGADGVVWRQLYHRSAMPMPRNGDSMRVHKGALGGYLCRVEDAPSFRCRPNS